MTMCWTVRSEKTTVEEAEWSLCSRKHSLSIRRTWDEDEVLNQSEAVLVSELVSWTSNSADRALYSRALLFVHCVASTIV